MLMGDKDDFFYTRTAQIKNNAPKGKLKKAFDHALSEIGVHYDDSTRRLKRAGIEVTDILVKGLGHTMTEESFDRSMKYLVKKLKK
jgi:hypothetical protein